MKKEIAIKFVDCYKGFDDKINYITLILAEKYELIFSDNPTYLFFDVFGEEHLEYDCVKIFFTCENMTPNFNHADYALGFNHMTFSDRYIRIPLYVVYNAFSSMKNKKLIDPEKVLNRKFCSFVYSNNKYSDCIRTDFFHILSKYKRIDSGGKLLNNMNGRVDDKLNFIKDYKFNIAFENSVLDGYTTEKIMEPMSVNSIPIYWGNPSISKDFNPKSFINAADFDSLEELAEYVAYLDKNDDAYIEKLKEPWLHDESMLGWRDNLKDFLFHIIDQNPQNAKKIPQHGRAAKSLKAMKKIMRNHDLKSRLNYLKKSLFKK